MVMVMHILENGKMIGLVEKVCIFQVVELSMKVHGKMINRKDKVKKNGLTGQFIEDSIRMGKNMGKEHFYGEIKADMKVSFSRIKYMERVNILGRMEESMKESGILIGCMEKECLLGLMEENTWDVIFKIKNMVLELLLSRMGGLMREIGKMENNMEKDYIQRKVLLDRGYGKMGKELNGLIRKIKLR